MRDKGVALTLAADFVSYETLIAATTGAAASGADIETGEYATCLADGMIRIAASPAGSLTVDAKGDSAGGYVSDTAGIVARLVKRDFGVLDQRLTGSDLDQVSFAALTAAQPAPVGVYVGAKPEIVSSIIDAMMRAIGGYWFFTLPGVLTVRRLVDGIVKPPFYVPLSDRVSGTGGRMFRA